MENSALMQTMNLKDIDAAVERIRFLLAQELDATSEFGSLESRMDVAARLLDDGKMGDNWVADNWAAYVSSGDTKLLLSAAVVHLVAAERLKHAGIRDAAWAALCESYYCYGLLSCADAAKSRAEREAAGIEHRRKGGGARTKNNFEPVHHLIADLLSKKKPAGGWSKKKDALNAIHEDVVEFVKDQRISLTESNLRATVSKWFESVPVVSQAFRENLQDENEFG